MSMEKPYRAEHEKMMHKQADERKDFVDRAHNEALKTNAERDAKKRQAEVERISKLPTDEEKIGREIERIAGQLAHVSPEELNKEKIELIVGGKTLKELEEALDNGWFHISPAMETVFTGRTAFEKGVISKYNPEIFSRVDHPEKMNFVRITPRQLGYIEGNTLSFKGVIGRALALGLDICPVDAALHYRRQYINQPNRECLYMAADEEDGDCFELLKSSNFLEINTVAADFTEGLYSSVDLDDPFIFRLKLEMEKAQK
mgnify:CR=1 FL=1